MGAHLLPILLCSCQMLLLLPCVRATDSPSADNTTLPVPERLTWRSNAESVAHPPVVVISMDGFRYDYFDLVPMRSLRGFARRGVHARRGMKGVFATVTFSSHWTLATGLFEESHGIVGNSFFDPETNTTFTKHSHDRYFFKGEPIWVAAKRAGRRVAVYNWVGGEVNYGRFSPDVAPVFSSQVSLKDRLQQILIDVTDNRMDLVMLYYHQPDRAGHSFGALSNEVLRELEIIDSELDHMFNQMERMGLKDQVNLILLSDHGIMNLTSDNPHIIIRTDDESLAKNAEQIVVGDTVCHFYIRGEGKQEKEEAVIRHLDQLRQTRGHFQVFAKNDIPERWHYRSSPRIGQVIAVANPGYMFVRHQVLMHVSPDKKLLAYPACDLMSRFHHHKRFQHKPLFTCIIQHDAIIDRQRNREAVKK